MRPIALALAALLLMPLAGVTAQAQDDMRRETVRFPAGATGTTIKGRIVGRQSVLHLVGAEAGQRMSVTLRTRHGGTYFNVYEPGRGPGDEALATAQTMGPMVPDLNRFEGTLPSSGMYSISVFMVRAAARRGERADYSLDIRITGKEGRLDEPVKGDFADGLQGGPDFWRVTGVGANDRLNVRAAPSSGARSLARVANGASLRNLGCRMAEGGRWCRVETLGGASVTGWASGRFLMEGAGPGAAAAPAGAPAGDALVPGTRFHATGPLPCARHAGQPMAQCQFGVVRRAGRSATVTIFWPDGGSRVIDFEAGQPVSFDRSSADGDARLSVEMNADLFMIRIGAQRFEIPEAVIAGG